jgi:hypothetical protein
MTLKHSTPATGTDTPGSQISVTAWNADHTIDNAGMTLASTGTGTLTTPSAGNIVGYNRLVANRTLFSQLDANGLITSMQPSLFGRHVVMYMPNNGTTIGLNLGTSWVTAQAVGQINHPTPATTAPAVVNQMYRTRFVNAATTTNQVIGITAMATGVPSFWLGNAAGLGGFFFYSRFIIELWPAATVRLFVGLSDQSTAVVTSDTYAGNLCGLSHITTDAATVLKFVTRNGTTATTTNITLTTALAAGQAFDFYMYAPPNSTTLYYRLDDINAGTTLTDTSTTATLPTNTAFMGPQITMSNGTANTTVTTTGIGIPNVYIESQR